MEDNVKQELDEIKNILRDNKPKHVSFTGIIWLLLILIFSNIYLCYNVFRESHGDGIIDSSHRVLVLSIEDDITQSESSDVTQVINALINGGQIRVGNSNNSFDAAFGSEYQNYGATNIKGSFWTRGAVLNYIASRGWTLVQTPSSRLSDDYYFVK